MPMTTAGMSAAIKASFISIKGAPADMTQLQEFCDALADALVPYIQSNALVNTTGADPQGGTVTSTGTVT